MSENTVRRGKEESQKLNSEVALDRVRAKGGGRKRKLEASPGLLEQIERLIQPHTKGDPMNPLRWTSKSTYRIAAELEQNGYKIHPDTVGSILKEQNYSLQLNRKEKESKQHEDRDAQFRHINERAKDQIESGRAAANGIKLSIRCFASFLKISGASHSLGNRP